MILANLPASSNSEMNESSEIMVGVDAHALDEPERYCSLVREEAPLLLSTGRMSAEEPAEESAEEPTING